MTLGTDCACAGAGLAEPISANSATKTGTTLAGRFFTLALYLAATSNQPKQYSLRQSCTPCMEQPLSQRRQAARRLDSPRLIGVCQIDPVSVVCQPQRLPGTFCCVCATVWWQPRAGRSGLCRDQQGLEWTATNPWTQTGTRREGSSTNDLTGLAVLRRHIATANSDSHRRRASRPRNCSPPTGRD